MDKLEQYLDRVCHSIGGPRALRQHVRQELREHLLDAVAQHQAEGLSPEQALERALEEFGAPQDIGGELVAAHGQRVIAVVIDKAMQWKERTMKAKWLWTSWAHLALLLVIAMEVLFVAGTGIFIVPKFQELMAVKIIDSAGMNEHMPWLLSSMFWILNFCANNGLLLVALVVAWIAFEWRVRSENKPFMRLAALGTIAVTLMVAVWITAGSLLLVTGIGVPGTGQVVQLFALDQVSHIESSVSALDQAATANDWDALEKHTDQASKAIRNLLTMPAALPSLARWDEIEVLQTGLKASSEALADLRRSIAERDSGRLGPLIHKLDESLAPLRTIANGSSDPG